MRKCQMNKGKINNRNFRAEMSELFKLSRNSNE